MRILNKQKYNTFDMISMAFKISPLYSCIETIQYLISAVIPAITVLVTAEFVNRAILLHQGAIEFHQIYTPAAWLAVIFVYGIASESLFGMIEQYRFAYFRRKIMP